MVEMVFLQKEKDETQSELKSFKIKYKDAQEQLRKMQDRLLQ